MPKIFRNSKTRVLVLAPPFVETSLVFCGSDVCRSLDQVDRVPVFRIQDPGGQGCKGFKALHNL